MWYFAWMLGMPLACCLAILNAMWLEMRSDDERYGRRGN
jgi:cytochrome bd-I ubiquinol oxidase subunit X